VVVLAGNTTTGAVSLTRNGTLVVVAGNTIGGSLSCSGNNPAPTDAGRPNTVSGLASGQCSALA
jgi:hexosaminidase